LQEGTGYQFWSRAAADGSFTIPKVRPGNYSLFAQVPGVVGIMERADVVVTSETTNDLGTVAWAPPRYERRLFRLGTPDLSAAEFRFGSEMRQYGLWWRYLEERGTNDLDFVVGSSEPSNDWYYALSLLPIEITATNGIWVSPRWNIHFAVDEVPPAPARLSVELSGAIQRCAFYVFVNGVNICPDPVSGISTVNDAGIYRSATQLALQQRFELTFDPNLLVVGTNTVSFTVRATGGRGNPWSGMKPVYPNAGIMFDCIQLEAGAPVTNAAPRFMRVEDSAKGLIMSGEGGFPGGAFYLLATTNLALSGWERVLIGEFDGGGRFAITNDADQEQEFYRLEIF
jgi:rhamnogalacturonan endolyase